VTSGESAGRDGAIAFAPSEPNVAASCCSLLYASPLAELLVRPSLHPGGSAGTRELLQAAGLAPGARLLDAGCGPGASARLAAAEFGLRVDALDANLTLIERAQSSGADRIRWRHADLLALPDGPATYDAALAECVISILPREPALAELRRVLRPGGRLLLSDVQVMNPIPELAEIGPLGSALCVTTAWGPGELEDQLPKAGFAIDRRWDRTSSIITLIDRIEARARVLNLAAHDLGLDLATIAPILGGPGLDALGLEPGAIRRSAAAVRAAVTRGDLRYVAVVATAT